MPPISAGARKLTVIVALPATAWTLRGAEGAVSHATPEDGLLAALSPAAFVAITVNVYVTPFVNPVRTISVASGPDTVPVIPPGEDVAVYDNIADPPLEGVE